MNIFCKLFKKALNLTLHFPATPFDLGIKLLLVRKTGYEKLGLR